MPTWERISGLLCAALLCAPLAIAQQTQHTPPKQLSGVTAQPSPSGPVVPAPAAAQIQQTPLPPPQTPEEMPATPPKVTMASGRLAIAADNSTLGDVLKAVKNVTGASLEMPGSAASERIAVNLGPGQPQQVLQQLFAGSRFDYIILGSTTNPSAVDKIILTARGATPGGPQSAVNQPPQNAYQPPPDQGDNDDETAQQPEPPPPPQEEPPQQPMVGPGGEAAAQDNNNNGQPKTPEQLLQELQQRMQQQGRPTRGAPPQ